MSNFSAQAFIKRTQRQLRETIGNNQVVCAFSGGVDSSTVVALLHSAGIHVTTLLIDTGFLRTGEVAQVCANLQAAHLPKPVILHKKQQFLQKLAGKVTADDKRIAFRDTYFAVLSKYLVANNITFFGQGTQSKPTANSRLYHNYPTPVFSRLQLKMVEPLIGITKTQVRKLAAQLHLPAATVLRRSFPGPGLLLRFGGAATRQKIASIRSLTEVVDQFVANRPAYFKHCYQIFPYLHDGTPVIRLHAGTVETGAVTLIRAVREQDNTFTQFALSSKVQAELVTQLLAVPNISRVCFDGTPKIGQLHHAVSGAPIEYQ